MVTKADDEIFEEDGFKGDVREDKIDGVDVINFREFELFR